MNRRSPPVEPARRWWGIGLGLLAAAALAALGAREFAAWRVRRALAEGQAAARAGRHAEALPLLRAAAAGWSTRDRAEADYWVGVCEATLGRPDAALAAWERVPVESAAGTRAALGRGRLALERGRFAVAETALDAAARGAELARRQAEADEAGRLLLQLFAQQGRTAEAQGQAAARWRLAGEARPDAALAALRTHAALDFEPPPVAGLRDALERLEPTAGSDPGYALARAHLALREGRHGEASAWLDRAGPPDATARARVALGLLAHDPATVDRAAGSAALGSTDRLALDAWRAGRRPDAAAERSAWEALLSADPAQPAALDRLAALALAAGDRPRAAELRRRKAALDDDLQAYVRLVKTGARADDHRRLAALAERLGRRFEARAFWSAVAARRPGDPEVRQALRRLAPSSAPERPAPRALSIVDLAHDALDAAPPRPTAPTFGIAFRDDTAASGLAFRFQSGTTAEHQLPETMAGGVGLIDYDGDGRLDVYCVQGGRFPPVAGPAGDRLFRNRGGGMFEDVTERAGVARLVTGYGHGVAVGDVDNDGRPDLFLTRWRSYTLLRNRGDGTFEDVTAAWGLNGDRDWPSSAAFADLDGDGDLDLFVCHYVAWDEAHPLLCPGSAGDRYATCDPKALPSRPDHLFRNDGGRFTDVSVEAGITAADRDGRGLGVVAADLDGDGKVDLFVANDGSANALHRNLGGLKFDDVAHTAGVAGNATGGYQAGMGVACADVDGDGRPDLAVTNFYGEGTSLFLNLGGGLFADRSAAAGLAAASRLKLGFGVALADLDNDGRPELATSNGHVNDSRPQFPYAMTLQLLAGTGGGRFADTSPHAGPPFGVERVGRGLAAGDLDDDGRVDLVSVALDGPTLIARNVSDRPGHWLTLKLEGTASNCDGVGAVVTVEAGGKTWTVARHGGGSYLSTGDPRLHVGLGDAATADAVTLRWPSGRVDRYEKVEADRVYNAREGAPPLRPAR